MRKKSLLHIIATGKYERYLKSIMDSAIENFLSDTDLKIVIYTDSKKILNSGNPGIIPVKIDHEPWPFPTLKRFHYFNLALDHVEKSDYSFYVDVDSLFRKKIDLDFLELKKFPGLIGTLHPGYYGNQGTPERRPQSTAYIPENSSNLYYCGGFFGGSSKNFIHLLETIRYNIDLDLSKNIIAIWHDESHLNKYFLNYPPIKSLGEGFSAPEEFVGGEKYKDPYLVFIKKPSDLTKDKELQIAK